MDLEKKRVDFEIRQLFRPTDGLYPKNAGAIFRVCPWMGRK